MKSPKPRGFEYHPFFARDPQLDEEEQGPRIKFKRLTRRPAIKKRPLLAFAILIIAIIVLWQYFQQLVQNDPKAQGSGRFQVEEVIVVE